jgi:hypothetical protein
VVSVFWYLSTWASVTGPSALEARATAASVPLAAAASVAVYGWILVSRAAWACANATDSGCVATKSAIDSPVMCCLAAFVLVTQWVAVGWG